MMGGGEHHEGTCHCGAVHVTLELSRPAEAVELRACQCAFCRRHGACTMTDRDGRALIAMREAGDLCRYQFGERTADFLLCARCGVYIAAVVDGRLGTVNAAGLDIPAFREHRAVAVDYSGESGEERLRRRRARWMPMTITVGAPAPVRQKEACL